MSKFITHSPTKRSQIKIWQLFQPTSGYTLFELIAALQLAFIVIGMIYLAYNQFQQQTDRWQQRIKWEAALSQLSHALTLTLDSAEKVLLANPDKFIAQSEEGDSITIELRDNIYINQHPLLKAVGMSLEKGRFSYYDKNLNQNRKKILGQKAWPYPFQIAKPVLILEIIEFLKKREIKRIKEASKGNFAEVVETRKTPKEIIKVGNFRFHLPKRD